MTQPSALPTMLEPTRPRGQVADPNAQKWAAVSEPLNRDPSLLRALLRVWDDKTPPEKRKLTEEERRKLQPIFARFPFGQTNFKAWVRQTLPQIQRNATIAA